MLAMFILSTAPTFTFAMGGNVGNQTQTQNNSLPFLKKRNLPIRMWMMLQLANRTATRIENLIIYINETLRATLEENATLLNDFKGNATLFNDAKNLLINASIAIEAENYEGAAANITLAMKTFKEVYKSLRTITEEHMATLKSQIDAQGLLTAMQRALERVERIEMLVPLDAKSITLLLGEARQYLNITAAKEMLAEGNVTAVSLNLVKANHLINKTYSLLKQRAHMMIWGRVKHYLDGMEKALQKIGIKIALAKMKGVDVSAVLEELGYQNETEFREALSDMITMARGKVSHIEETLLELQHISQAFWRMNRALTRHLHQSPWKPHESQGGPGLGQGQNQTQSKAGIRGAGLGRGNNSARQGKP